MNNLIELHRSGFVATISFNREDRLNALNLAAWRELATAFETVSADMDLRCVVLRGMGCKAFAAGADISEFATLRSDPVRAENYDATLRRGLAAVADCPHPVVAQIYGPCVGAGLELAAQCDLRLAARSARFGVPVGKISVVMTLPELAGLQRLVGPARMSEILLEGRVFPADEALSMGLVHRVVEDEALEGEVQATLRRITANAPLVNRRHKAFIRRVGEGGAFSAADLAAAHDCLQTRDFAEGMAAFSEKRPPRFIGA
ncbi:enoyl-CoA hydratase/isomerase family protein [Telmatospirillum siberiense]|uniref:Enoyl-CoA hydratase n=1 Tax=Telmatospirillum siberiense TaxID=382514 RepID=A0A2N3PR42_9PROT|nr:enoyl-CoA hydratase-related protein [Telmatospirillum siberiense]PKU22880.1 enoyl-CoA hydratase [Telmatospirillum siberiense]